MNIQKVLKRRKGTLNLLYSQILEGKSFQIITFSDHFPIRIVLLSYLQSRCKKHNLLPFWQIYTLGTGLDYRKTNNECKT